jgi:hypothetical protein
MTAIRCAFGRSASSTSLLRSPGSLVSNTGRHPPDERVEIGEAAQETSQANLLNDLIVAPLSMFSWFARQLNGTFTESLPAVPTRCRLTGRLTGLNFQADTDPAARRANR